MLTMDLPLSPLRPLRLLLSYIFVQFVTFVDEFRLSQGIAWQDLAKNARKWQNGTVWYSPVQVQTPQYAANKRVTKNDGQKNTHTVE